MLLMLMLMQLMLVVVVPAGPKAQEVVVLLLPAGREDHQVLMCSRRTQFDEWPASCITKLMIALLCSSI